MASPIDVKIIQIRMSVLANSCSLWYHLWEFQENRKKISL